ncbi:glycoside hydrolase family 2 protein [Amnibacterium sp.]|uniref:glycoside hydrolase family 2 protein n=1 Tax=Amnibacterium sp. TaxID=1872496 RepID=UPI003F7BF5F1
MTPVRTTFERRLLHEGWTVEALGGPVPEQLAGAVIPAQVPGVVHTDLLRAGRIADPFDGDNEAAQQWIGDTDWRYRTVFEWHDDGSARHDLVADGLDTVATVRLNGVELGRTENQHRSYRWDVREHLVDGTNALEIDFAAPVPETERRAERYGAMPRVNHHEFNQLRKTAANFGWDWGIDVATSGIWRPIALESWSGTRIAAVRPLVDVVAQEGVLTAHVDLESDGVSERAVEVALEIAGTVVREQVEPGATSAVVRATVPDVAVWWPIGHGEQPLYPVVATTDTDRWEGRVGFRTVAVDTAPDAHGRPFTVLVNGRPILIRGVNWIPDHAFVTEVDRARLERRFDDMTEGNINLARVWGGGIYESEDFYDLADERGVLVWQDFLLACAAYSEEAHLATEIEAEAREQITRLSQHPSLIIWNGCNENIWGFVEWGWAAALGGRAWGDGYYRGLFPKLVAELDPTRFYSPGSPFSFGEYLHPDDPRNGTMHIWDVWNTRDYTAYREHRPRFAAEFGFQGPPAWSTLARVVHDEPLDPFGHEMLVHQKAHRGNEKLARGAAAHLPQPRSIDDWHWGMQLNQAHAVRFGVEHFRSLTPLNTGTVVWQLNDDWPVVSWAAVDFDGHRKPLWYALREAYAPRLATLQPRSSDRALAAAFEGEPPVEDVLALVLVNDVDEPLGGSATVQRLALDGSVLASAVLPVAVAPRDAATIELPPDVSAWGDRTGEVIVAEGAFGRVVLNGAEVVDQALDATPLDAVVERVEDGYLVSVAAHAYVRDVTLLVDRVDPAATVDRGLVTLLPGERTAFRVRCDAVADPDAFTRAPVLRSANDLR